MKTSEILRLAKDKLWDGKGAVRRQIETPALCFALARTKTHRHYAISKRIRKSLGRFYYVREWLEKEVGVPPSELTNENVQAYRHRWIDELIREYEARND